MSQSVEPAYAKLNLALHVRRRAADGYHAIETLFAFTDAGDRLTLAGEPGLAITGPFAAGLDRADNLVMRAANAFAGTFGGAEAGFRLEKNLPVAAGLGGGSADAAAALRLLARRDGIDAGGAELVALARTLGADVPACLLSRTCRGTGRGDMLAPLADDLAGTAVLLVNPGVALATGAVFARWDGIDRGALAEGEVMAAAKAGRNDLEPAALALRPAIGSVLAALAAQPGARLVRMSGSGATCFALFDGAAARDAAARAIVAAEPGWWRLATVLR